MNETFKYSTILAKIVIASLIMAAFMLSLTKTHAKTPNEELVLRSIRVSLWYKGTQVKNGKNGNEPQEVATIEEFYPEELYRALEKHDEQKKVSFARQ